MTALAPRAAFTWRSAPSRAAAFVWRSWRGITMRDVRWTLLLGLVVGVMQGGGAALASRQPTVWRVFVSPLIDAMIPAVMLLLCLSVARNVKVKRVPKWTPFVLAAIAAVVLSSQPGAIVTMVIEATGDDVSLWPGLTMDIVSGLWLNLPPTVLMCFLASLGYMFARDVTQRAEALRNVQLGAVKLSRQSYESRLQAMQARVEPQFLFDTLNQIERLYETDPVVAEGVLDDLIVYLRGVLPSLADSTSILATELEIARAWLAIMKVRTKGRLAFTITSSSYVRDARIPPMLLLPLVDHAVQFVMRSLQPAETISIDVSVDRGRLKIALTDSSQAFAPPVNGVPIAEVRERLHALYGADATLSFRAMKPGATQAVVEIPHEREQ